MADSKNRLLYILKYLWQNTDAEQSIMQQWRTSSPF